MIACIVSKEKILNRVRGFREIFKSHLGSLSKAAVYSCRPAASDEASRGKKLQSTRWHVIKDEVKF